MKLNFSLSSLILCFRVVSDIVTVLLLTTCGCYYSLLQCVLAVLVYKIYTIVVMCLDLLK